MNALIIGGWILIVGNVEGPITVIPTQYASKELCEAAAGEAIKGLPSSIGFRCLRAGEGAKGE